MEAVELNNLQKPRIFGVFLEVGKMGSALFQPARLKESYAQKD